MKKLTLFLAMVLMVTIGFSGNALALALDVSTEAQIARHIDVGYEWVLAWNNSIDGDPDKIKMKGFKLDNTRGIDKPTTSGLYGTGDTSVLYIRNDKKKMKKWLKKAAKQGLNDSETYAYINEMFAAKTKGWKVKGKADGEKFGAKVLFGGEYNNPDDGVIGDIGEIVEDNGTPSLSVPEPATLFLLGVGLMGLSAIRRTRIKSGQ
jgi:hypothetical protein